MPLETATTLNQLVPANPAATDAKSQGDDHLRLIKQVLQNTFPAVAGVVSASHAQLNYTSATRANWFTRGNVNLVSGYMGWRKYGDAQVIFDASNGTDPSGAACSQSDSATVWAVNQPTLMGYNGATTFGVKVDTSRYAENAIGANQVWTDVSGSRSFGTTFTNSTPRAIVVVINLISTGGASFTLSQDGQGIHARGTGAAETYSLVTVVRPGGTYFMGVSGYTLSTWKELR